MKLKLETLLVITILLAAAIIRLYRLDNYPAGLNADEAAIGYNAYSVLQTGRDEHGARWPLVFESFGDFKPPAYFYIVMPFVAVLGLNVWSVRLPSALLGIAAVWLVYRLTNLLFKQKFRLGRNELSFGLLAALMLTLSPWHIHFSRGGWEANVATTFILAGIVCLYEQPRRYLLAGFAFTLSLYTYHSARLITPLLLLIFILLERRLIFTKVEWRKIFLPLVACILFTVPLVLQLTTSAEARFSGVSIFADSGPLWEALALRAEDANPGSLPSRLLHNRYVSYSLRYAKNYLGHFSPRFLFFTGDEIERSRVPGMGQLYLLTLPFLIIGTLTIMCHPDRKTKFIMSWLIVAPMAAAITFQSPHALRAQNMSIPLALITAIGLGISLNSFRQTATKKITVGIFLVVMSFETARWANFYFLHYPQELPTAWEYGFAQLAEYLKTSSQKYDQIIISDRYDQPYILIAFFLKIPPQELQQAKLEARDQFGFSTVRQFGKYEFRRINFKTDMGLDKLLVLADELAEGKPLEVISFPNGTAAFRLYSSGSTLQP